MFRPACGATALVLLLAGCGGGGGSGAAPAVDISAVAKNDPGSTLPADWARKGAFMEIYVRGFRDSNGDGIGDLKGLTQSLDYLQDLGIKGIWLMPVTRSQDHDHGYAVEDYRTIERDYGTLADMDELVAAAHARGIGVIIDYVINHSSATNPLFRNARSALNNPYRNWYIWQDSDPGTWNIYGRSPWYAAKGSYYFAGFWDQMPDWNLRNPDVVAYQDNNLRFWLNRGVDGFRFDAVGNLIENGPTQWELQPENRTHMSNVRTLLSGYSNRYMVCEVPGDPQGFNPSCGSAFAFGLNYSLIQAVNGSSSAVQSVGSYFRTASPTMATMAANHDYFAGARIYDQVGGNVAKYKLVAATYLTLPGTPFIYYGEEIGMAGASGLQGDAQLRGPLSWTASGGFTSGTPFRPLATNTGTFNVSAEQADPTSLLNHYKALLNLRNTHTALSVGSYEHSVTLGNTLTFQRIDGSDRVLVVINYDASQQTINVANLPGNAALTPLYPATLPGNTSNGSGQAAVTLGGRSVAIYQF